MSLTINYIGCNLNFEFTKKKKKNLLLNKGVYRGLYTNLL